MAGICWLPNGKSDKLVVADSLPEAPVFETPTKAKTGPLQIAAKDDSPTLVSPSKNIAAHGCRILDDENDVANKEEEHDQEVVERALAGSVIWKRNDDDDGA